MTIEVRVPQLPESVADATLVAWHKKPGDSVVRDENLVDLETDKVVLEVPAPVAEPVPYQRVPTGETVLVVEDEEALREVTKRIFTRNGYHVVTAADGPDALDIARHHDGEIHLLVTDVVMPHMLGKEVAEQVLLIKPGAEVLYMSGYARPVLASQGRLEPGVALVEKPFSEASLLAMAGQVLNGHFPGFTTSGGGPAR